MSVEDAANSVGHFAGFHFCPDGSRDVLDLRTFKLDAGGEEAIEFAPLDEINHLAEVATGDLVAPDIQSASAREGSVSDADAVGSYGDIALVEGDLEDEVDPGGEADGNGDASGFRLWLGSDGQRRTKLPSGRRSGVTGS